MLRFKASAVIVTAAIIASAGGALAAEHQRARHVRHNTGFVIGLYAQNEVQRHLEPQREHGGG